MTLSCEIERWSERIAKFWIKVVFRLLRPTRLANEEKQKTEHQSADLHVHNVRLTGAHRFLSQLGRTHNGSTINRERCVSQPATGRNRCAPLVGCSVLLGHLRDDSFGCGNETRISVGVVQASKQLLGRPFQTRTYVFTQISVGWQITD